MHAHWSDDTLAPVVREGLWIATAPRGALVEWQAPLRNGRLLVPVVWCEQLPYWMMEEGQSWMRHHAVSLN
jgi:hypothetical protein